MMAFINVYSNISTEIHRVIHSMGQRNLIEQLGSYPLIVRTVSLRTVTARKNGPQESGLRGSEILVYAQLVLSYEMSACLYQVHLIHVLKIYDFP